MTEAKNGTNFMVQGRIVWGIGKNIFEGKPKTDQNGNPVYDKMGNQAIEYGFGLAIPKVDPQTGQQTQHYVTAYQAIHGEGAALYPNGLPANFAKKYKDGDTDVMANGNPYSQKEGYANHIVISCTTRIPLKFYVWQNGQNVMVNDGIKVGDYVNVQLNVKGHGPINNGAPGVYVNPSAVQLIQPGKAIINAPSGDDIFGQAAPSAYSGVVEAPTAPTMPDATVPTPSNTQAGMPSPQPTMPTAPAATPEAPSHYGVLPNNMQPQGQATMPNPGMPAPQQPVANQQQQMMTPPMPGQPQ